MRAARLAGFVAVVVTGISPQALTRAPGPVDSGAAPAAAIRRNIHLRGLTQRAPVGFEVNRGQFDSRVDFVARRTNAAIHLAAGDATIVLRRSQQAATTLQLKLAGRNARPGVEGLDAHPARVNYFHGRDPKTWRSGVRTYSRVRYHELYRGVDVVYYFDETGQLEFDFVVAPGADPGAARFRLEGAGVMTVDRQGNLNIETSAAPILMRAPRIFQRINGIERTRHGRYVIGKDRTIGFAIDEYDRRAQLWIDPAFDYSTYLGGADTDEAKGIAADAAGNMYVTGFTWSADFPTRGAWQPSITGGRDAFVTKLDASGVVQYSTYIGGPSSDEGHGIAVDAAGNAYVTGTTLWSTFIGYGFPTTAGAFQVTGNSNDAFVAKFDADGILVASTLLGGSSSDDGFGIAVDAAGRPYVTGSTGSSNFPTASPLQPAYRGAGDAFVTKFNADLTHLEYSTFLGGTYVDRGAGIGVDAAGRASIVGYTASTDFPTANAVQTTLAGASDAFVAKLDAAGSAFVFSTYFGGALPVFTGGSDEATSVAVDAADGTIVGGFTDSVDLPTVGAFQPSISGPPNPINGGFENEGFIARFAADGALVHSTYLGGNGSDLINGIAADGAGNIFATGFTRSTNFPLTGPDPSPIADAGAFKSPDAGGTWTRITNGLTSPTVTAIAVDPVEPNVVYAGTDNDGVFKSTDGGATWARSSSGLWTLFVTTLVVDPIVPSTIYAGTTGGGVNKSVDGGATWTRVNIGLLIPNVISLTMDPTHPSTLFAGTLMRGAAILYKTVNGGANWTAVFGNEINTAAVDPSSSSTVYAGSGVLLFKSTNGGTAWTQIFREPLSINHFTSVLVDPSQPSTVYAATDGNGVFKSVDAGATWQPFSTGLSNRAVISLSLDPSQPATLYAGTFGTGVFKSVNGGAAWFASNAGLSQAIVTQLAVDPRTPSTLYGAVDGLLGDAFIAVVGASGALEYSSYAGGTRHDFAAGVAAGPAGRLHITGRTRSTDWPVSSNAAQRQFGRGFTDGFVATLACALPLSIQASVDPDLLWPPNHQMEPVTVDYPTSGGCGPVVCSIDASSSEAANGLGDGDSEPDIQTVDAHQLLLRAERSATGPGRTYTITVSCSDSAGQSVRRSVDVVVPISR